MMDYPIEGGCTCGLVRYHMLTQPLVVHCCHCRWCQRETGASFALNAMIESDRVEHLGAEPELQRIPSESGYGQQLARCPRCKVAVWSHYPGSGPLTRFVRVGTLDTPDAFPPDVHVCAASKQPWVALSGEVPVCEEFYERAEVWREESLARIAVLQPQIDAYRATRQPMARPPFESEIDPLARLWQASWHDAHAGLLPAAIVRQRTLGDFTGRLRSNLANVRVAGPIGAPVGLCIIRDDELDQLFVSASARGTGVAAALLADAEARLAVPGVRTAWLACAIGNDRAAGFYRKHGWHRAGTAIKRVQTDEGEVGFDVWRFEKEMGTP